MDSKHILKEISPTTLEIQLEGTIDELSRFPMDYDYSNYTSLYFDFSKVSFINSAGIKVWVNFSEKLGSYERLRIFYRNCNRMVVDQINKTMGFLGNNAEVLSVNLPVFCNRCESSFQVFQEIKGDKLETQEVFAKVKDPGCGNFPKCKKNWELDFLEREFFKFIERQKKKSTTK